MYHKTASWFDDALRTVGHGLGRIQGHGQQAAQAASNAAHSAGEAVASAAQASREIPGHATEAMRAAGQGLRIGLPIAGAGLGALAMAKAYRTLRPSALRLAPVELKPLHHTVDLNTLGAVGLAGAGLGAASSTRKQAHQGASMTPYDLYLSMTKDAGHIKEAVFFVGSARRLLKRYGFEGSLSDAELAHAKATLAPGHFNTVREAHDVVARHEAWELARKQPLGEQLGAGWHSLFNPMPAPSELALQRHALAGESLKARTAEQMTKLRDLNVALKEKALAVPHLGETIARHPGLVGGAAAGALGLAALGGAALARHKEATLAEMYELGRAFAKDASLGGMLPGLARGVSRIGGGVR